MARTQRLALYASLIAVVLSAAFDCSAQARYLDRPPQDEVIYLVMPDRFENATRRNDTGGMRGTRLEHGFDPTDRAFYHGGDLQGVIRRLDYIQGLGATALWLTPVFRNMPVQRWPGRDSAGYHGYWGLDFTDIDPHLGTRADYRALVDAAHARGMKVYFDIVVNHTADVIRYRECESSTCTYRSRGDYPGKAYTPYVAPGPWSRKSPAWLNDTSLYHNRGESTFTGESSLFGDFVGLDDVNTEDPRVVQGFIDLYGQWIEDFHLDGFRVDTARHVDEDFWRAFIPAMQERARAAGIPNFHVFGEVMLFEPGLLAKYVNVDGFPSVNDFAFQSAVVRAIAQGEGTDVIARVIQSDSAYGGDPTVATRLVTLIGNHDVGRFAKALKTARPDAGDAELLARMRLANALLLLSRGVPALYYGDEQGFLGVGDVDQDGREDMFPSQVASYNRNDLIGTAATTRDGNFDRQHPLYAAIRELVDLRMGSEALRRGTQTIVLSEDKPGLLAFTREYAGAAPALVVLNTSQVRREVRIPVPPGHASWKAMAGQCQASQAGANVVALVVEPLDYAVCMPGA